MTRKAKECDNCGADYTVIYDPEEVDQDPIHCPFCGDVASSEDQDNNDLEIEEDWE